MRGFLVLLAGMWIIGAVVFLSADALSPHLADAGWVAYLAAFILWCFGVASLSIFVDTHFRDPRPKPEGYVGKFRRPDGRIVHVARLKDGTLTVASEEPPGIPVKDLGPIAGRELLTWTKLGSSPDGENIARVK